MILTVGVVAMESSTGFMWSLQRPATDHSCKIPTTRNSLQSLAITRITKSCYPGSITLSGIIHFLEFSLAELLSKHMIKASWTVTSWPKKILEQNLHSSQTLVLPLNGFMKVKPTSKKLTHLHYFINKYEPQSLY